MTTTPEKIKKHTLAKMFSFRKKTDDLMQQIYTRYVILGNAAESADDAATFECLLNASSYFKDYFKQLEHVLKKIESDIKTLTETNWNDVQWLPSDVAERKDIIDE